MPVARLLLNPLTGPSQLLSVAPELRVGRGPHNDLVLPSADVSWSHTLFRCTGGSLVVEDLGSRNGTFLDGVRIVSPVDLVRGGVVTIGDASFSLHGRADDLGQGTMVVEDVAARVRYPLQPPSFTVGGPDGDIQLPGVEPVVLEVDTNGVSLGGERLEVPWAGDLAGRSMRILSMDMVWTPTLPNGSHAPERHLRIGLAPPRARVFERLACATHTVTSENRVSLLFFLAMARRADLAAGIGFEECGWRSDAAISVGVWGRSGLDSSRNRLNALTYRLRQELVENGLAPDLIEKKPGWARLGFCELVLDE